MPTTYEHTVDGVKGHERLVVHVDRPGVRTIWVRVQELNEKGQPHRGVHVPLAINSFQEFLAAGQAALDYALSTPE